MLLLSPFLHSLLFLFPKVFHAIDKVLFPSTVTILPSFFDAALATGKFGILLSLLDAAGLTKQLDMMASGITVFAPTDEAFGDLPFDPASLAGNIGGLVQILAYHVVGQRLLTTDFETGPVATLVPGESVNVMVADGIILVNDAVVVEADILGSNGVIHGIDSKCSATF